MPTGKDPEIKGTAGGYPGGVGKEKHHSPIGDHVFASDWASPLNASNSGQPGPQPMDAGGIQETDGMEIPNPLGIPNVERSGKGGSGKGPSKSHRSKANGG